MTIADTPEKKSRRKTADTPRFDRREINESLQTIYQDETGRLPNMKEITIKKKSNPFFRVLSYLFGLGIILSLLAWVGVVLAPRQGATTDDQIDFSINGPSMLSLDTDNTYTITYTNHYTVPLSNVTVDIYYPDNFQFGDSDPAADNDGHDEWTVGTLAPGASGTITIDGKQYGNAGDKEAWRGFITYTPANFNSELQKAATLLGSVQNTPFTLSVSGPDQVTAGSSATYTFTVATTSDWTDMAFLIPNLPSTFTITSSSPPLVKNRWELDMSNASTSLVYTLQGTFGTSETSTPSIGGELAVIQDGQDLPLADATISTELAKNDPGFYLTINGSTENSDVAPGQTLAVTLGLKNNNTTDIKNGVINLSLEAPSVSRQSALAWASINDPANGNIIGQQLSDSVRSGNISWNSGQIPSLADIAPMSEVTTTFSLPIKSTGDFNYGSVPQVGVIIAKAMATFTNSAGKTVTIALDPVTLTLQSDLTFSENDSVTGQSHTITWTLTNSFHPLKNITVQATAYGDVSFAKSTISTGDITFDPTADQVSWAIPSLPLNTTSANGSFVLTLNKVNPSQTTLLSNVSVQAEDDTTGKILELNGNPITLSP